MNHGRRQLFIYWRLPAASLDAALMAVRTAQHELEMRHASLSAALYIRTDARTAEATVMESYSIDSVLHPEGIDARLQREIAARGEAATAAFGLGPRHVEVFDAVV